MEYKTPVGWRPGRLSSMRKAAFLLPGGGPRDEVTVMNFSAEPNLQMGNVAAKVHRWVSMVGIKPLADDAAAEKLTTPITISGIEGIYVELTSPAESEQKMSLHVAMILQENSVWFFKMSGDTDLIEDQREIFQAFLDSVKFK